MEKKFEPAAMLDMVPPEIASGVGTIVTQWAWSEAMLDGVIWRLLRSPSSKGRVVTSQLGAASKIEAVVTLLNMRRFTPAVVKHIQKEGPRLAGLRNLVAHGYIAANPMTSIVTALSYRAKGGVLRNRSHRLTEDRLKRLAVQIATFNIYLLERVHLPLNPNPKPPPRVRVSKDADRALAAYLRSLPPLLLDEPAKPTRGKRSRE